MNAPRLSADARREQILDVAIEVFGRAGYYGASMNDIADAAGVTKPVLYQHFDSKSDLYSALLDEVGNRMISAISKATANARDGRETTEQGFLAYFRWVANSHDEFMLLFGGSARHDANLSAQIGRITDEAAAAITPLITIDIDPEYRQTLAHALVGLAEGASRRLVGLGKQFNPDEIAREISALAWAGLRVAHRVEISTDL
jgi:AcrR family transcriptional regulator